MNNQSFGASIKKENYILDLRLEGTGKHYFF